MRRFAALAGVLCAALLAVGPLGCIVRVRAPALPEVDREEIDAFFDSMVDRHLEAGYEDPVLRADDALLARRAIVVTATINERTAKDVIARLLVLDAKAPGRPIDLFISTQGGWTDTTFAIVDAIESIQAPVNTWAVGGVYSAGTLLVAAGTGRRVAVENALLMVHASFDDPAPDSFGDLDRRRVEAFWRRRARLPDDWFPMTGERTHYLTPARALELDIVDALVPER